MERLVTLVLGGREFIATRARLGGFLRLQAAHRAVREAAARQENGPLADALYAYLCAGLGSDIDRALFETAPWFDVVGAFLVLADLNRIPNEDNFSILRDPARGKPVPWDHPNRSVILWIHLIASRYGWSREAIEDLWPEEAVAYLQEILADDQEEREFVSSLSEVSWVYDKRTKKSRLQQIPRPNWMVVRRDKALGSRTRIPKRLLPIGNVVKLHGGPNGH